MIEPNEHISEAGIAKLKALLDRLPAERPANWVMDVPFGPGDLMREGRITYGGKPMEPLLPSRAEFQFLMNLNTGGGAMPVHDLPAPP